MQKLFTRAPIAYFTFLLLITIPAIVLLSLGYRFIVFNEIIWFVLHITAEGILTALCLVKRIKYTKTATIIAHILPVLAFLYICAIGSMIDGVNDLLLTGHGLLFFISCFAISLLDTGRFAFQSMCTGVNSILFLFLLMGAFLTMTFGQIGQNTIVRQEVSPDESYTAILIDSDQGALGGDTLVDIEHHASTINIGLGQFVKITRLYCGSWGEFETMHLEWKDSHTLLINGTPYSIIRVR